MSNIGSVDNNTNVTSVSDQAQWDDSQHSKLVDFFHRHCPKVTKDVVAVGNDIKKGFEGVKKMVGDDYEACKDFESAAKNEGFVSAVKQVVENTFEGHNPLDGIATKQHINAIRDDARNLEDVVQQLEKDAVPLEQDALIAAQNCKVIVGDVIDLVQQGMAIYGGNVNPQEFGRVFNDLKSIYKSLEAALQMNPTAARDATRHSSSAPVQVDDSNSVRATASLSAANMLRTNGTDTDNRTQDKRHHERHHHHHRNHKHV